MVMQVTMLFLSLLIDAILSKFRYLLLLSLLIFISSRLIQYVTPLITAAVLYCSYRRLTKVLGIA